MRTIIVKNVVTNDTFEMYVNEEMGWDAILKRAADEAQHFGEKWDAKDILVQLEYADINDYIKWDENINR